MSEEATRPKIEFLRWKDPRVVTRQDYDEGAIEDQALVDLLDSASSQPFRSNGTVVVGPEGLIPVAPHNATSELYNLWVMHTNFHLTPAVMERIQAVPGVEILRPWTPYRAWFGVGRLFDHEKVFHGVRTALSVG